MSLFTQPHLETFSSKISPIVVFIPVKVASYTVASLDYWKHLINSLANAQQDILFILSPQWPFQESRLKEAIAVLGEAQITPSLILQAPFSPQKMVNLSLDAQSQALSLPILRLLDEQQRITNYPLKFSNVYQNFLSPFIAPSTPFIPFNAPMLTLEEAPHADEIWVSKEKFVDFWGTILPKLSNIDSFQSTIEAYFWHPVFGFFSPFLLKLFTLSLFFLAFFLLIFYTPFLSSLLLIRWWLTGLLLGVLFFFILSLNQATTAILFGFLAATPLYPFILLSLKLLTAGVIIPFSIYALFQDKPSVHRIQKASYHWALFSFLLLCLWVSLHAPQVLFLYGFFFLCLLGGSFYKPFNTLFVGLFICFLFSQLYTQNTSSSTISLIFNNRILFLILFPIFLSLLSYILALPRLWSLPILGISFGAFSVFLLTYIVYTLCFAPLNSSHLKSPYSLNSDSTRTINTSLQTLDYQVKTTVLDAEPRLCRFDYTLQFARESLFTLINITHKDLLYSFDVPIRALSGGVSVIPLGVFPPKDLQFSLFNSSCRAPQIKFTQILESSDP